MASARLIAFNDVSLPVIGEKTSAGMVARKGLDYYMDWAERHTIADLCVHLLNAAESYPSVLEHVVFTFYVEGCSRACTHQLVRHRLASYTQESQRYSVLACDPKGTARLALARLHDGDTAGAAEALSKCLVIPESIRGLGDRAADALRVMAFALDAYALLVDAGVPAEDARYVLPQAVKSRLIMTVNLRELLHIARLRTSQAAQWEIRGLVESMVEEVFHVLPCIRDLIERYRG